MPNYRPFLLALVCSSAFVVGQESLNEGSLSPPQIYKTGPNSLLIVCSANVTGPAGSLQVNCPNISQYSRHEHVMTTFHQERPLVTKRLLITHNIVDDFEHLVKCGCYLKFSGVEYIKSLALTKAPKITPKDRLNLIPKKNRKRVTLTNKQEKFAWRFNDNFTRHVSIKCYHDGKVISKDDKLVLSRSKIAIHLHNTTLEMSGIYWCTIKNGTAIHYSSLMELHIMTDKPWTNKRVICTVKCSSISKPTPSTTTVAFPITQTEEKNSSKFSSPASNLQASSENDFSNSTHSTHSTTAAPFDVRATVQVKTHYQKKGYVIILSYVIGACLLIALVVVIIRFRMQSMNGLQRFRVPHWPYHESRRLNIERRGYNSSQEKESRKHFLSKIRIGHLPFDLKLKLSRLLSQNNSSCKDWRDLAFVIDIDRRQIEAINHHDEERRAELLFDYWEEVHAFVDLWMLILALEKISRFDIIDVIISHYDLEDPLRSCASHDVPFLPRIPLPEDDDSRYSARAYKIDPIEPKLNERMTLSADDDSRYSARASEIDPIEPKLNERMTISDDGDSGYSSRASKIDPFHPKLNERMTLSADDDSRYSARASEIDPIVPKLNERMTISDDDDCRYSARASKIDPFDPKLNERITLSDDSNYFFWHSETDTFKPKPNYRMTFDENLLDHSACAFHIDPEKSLSVDMSNDYYDIPDPCIDEMPMYEKQDDLLDRSGSSKSRASTTISKMSYVSGPNIPKPDLPDTVNPDLCAWGLFSEEGGILKIVNTGVQLYIPNMALSKGASQMIYIGLMNRKALHPKLEDGQAVLSPAVICGPDGLQFNKPVFLTMPHNVVAEDTKSWNPQVQSCQTVPKEEKDIKEWKTMEDIGKTQPFSCITNNSVQIMIEHFTGFCIVGNVEKLAKFIVPYYTPPEEDRDCSVRIYSIPATKTALEELRVEENGVPADPPKRLVILNNKKDILTMATNVKDGWEIDDHEQIIPFKDVWHTQSSSTEGFFPSVTFIFTRWASNQSSLTSKFNVKQNMENSDVVTLKVVTTKIGLQRSQSLSSGYATFLESNQAERIPTKISPVQKVADLCLLLDKPDEIEWNDYRRLGEELGMEKHAINWLTSRSRSPTKEILNWWEATKPDEPIAVLIQALERMGRADALEVLRETTV